MSKFFKKKTKKTNPVPASDSILNLQDLMVCFQQASHLSQHSSSTHGNQAAGEDQMQVDVPIPIPSFAPPGMMNSPDHGQMQADQTVAGPSSSTAQNVQSDLPQGWRRRRNRVSSTVSVGQDQAFNHVCDFLREDDVCTVGIYGMGGVGKTTLLKKIRREFLEPSNFNAIWVTVSKFFDADRIQREVMKGMQLCFDRNNSKNKRADQIQKEAKEKKVALLIDDIWEGFNLEELEILDRVDFDPSNFKVIFTTRSEMACNYMQFDESVRVECLSWNDSWNLFERNVGKGLIKSNYRIRGLARKVAQECKGLPLALIVTGKAMACKYTIGEWNHPLVTLQKSPSVVPDLEITLFARLRLSYDYLPSDAERNCFLYCCLFPEDQYIYSDVLVDYWVAEGFLGLNYNLEEACNRGCSIIGTLQVANLLERGFDNRWSKMHDVIRDMGLWILSKMEQTYFVHGGSNLTATEIEEKWRAAHRVYVLNGDKLPQEPLCCNLSTLIFQRDFYSHGTIRISDAFFRPMNRLKVLELSNVHFEMSAPVGIGQLEQLRYLYVGNSNLDRLPEEIRQLTKLEMLYLNHNENLRVVPEIIGELHNLRSLQFYSASALPMELWNLRKLEFLSVSFPKETFEDQMHQRHYLEEISTRGFGKMTNLTTVKLGVRNFVRLPTDLWDLTQLENLEIMCGDQVCDNVDVVEGNLIHGLERLSHSLRRLSMWSWSVADWNQLLATLLHSMSMLSEIVVQACSVKELETPRSSSISCLTALHFFECQQLEKIDIGPTELQNLTILNLKICFSVKILGIEHLKGLVELTIEDCGLFEVIQEDVGQVCFPNLQVLVLKYLWNLRSICSDIVLFSSLKKFELMGCPKLKRLPRGLMNCDFTLSACCIFGTRRWWDGLQWSDEGFKSFIYQHFDEWEQDELLSSEIEEDSEEEKMNLKKI